MKDFIENLESPNVLVDYLSNKSKEELSYIKTVGDLQNSEEEPRRRNTHNLSNKLQVTRDRVRTIQNNLSENEAVELIKKEGRGNVNIHNLTEEGLELYENTQVLFYNLEDVKEAIEKVANHEHMNTSKHSVEVELGRTIPQNVFYKGLNLWKQEIEENAENRREKRKETSKKLQEETDKIFERKFQDQ